MSNGRNHSQGSGRRPSFDWEHVDWSLSSTVIARQLGCDVSTVTHARRRRDRGTLGWWWTPEKEALLGTAPDPDLAQRWGVCRQTVFRRRKKLQIPPYA